MSLRKITLSLPAFLGVLLLALSSGSQAQVTLKLPTPAPVKTAWHTMLERYVKRVAELSHDDVKVVPYYGGQLGSQQNTMNMMVRGRLDMWTGALPGMTAVSPELAVISLPYIFKDETEANCVIPKIIKPTNELVKNKMHFLGFLPVGWQGVALKEPLSAPKDFKGVKVRVPPQQAEIDFWKEVGANAVALPGTQISEALSTGMVDGSDAPFIYYMATGQGRLAPYFLETGESFNVATLVVGKRTWDRLTQSQQQALTQGMDAIRFPEMSKLLDADLAQFKKKAKKTGVTIIKPTKEERAEWMAIGRKSLKKTMQSISGDPESYYKKIEAAKDQCAK